MAIISNNTFTAPDTTTLQTYVGETGIGWEKHLFHSNNATIVGGQAKSTVGIGTGYLSLNVPTSDNHSIQFDAVINSIAANKDVGVYIRMNQNVSRTGYLLRTDTGNGRFILYRYVNGSAAAVATWAFAFSAGTIYTVDVITDIDANGNPTFELFVDTVKQGTTVADTNVNAPVTPGRIGIWFQSNLNFIDNVSINNILVASLAVTNILNSCVIQRSGSVAAKEIKGTYSDGETLVAAGVRARIMNGTTTIVQWTVIDSALSGGTFSGVLNFPVNGQTAYTLELSFSNDVTVTDTVTDILVGDLFIVQGQSNGWYWFNDAGAAAPTAGTRVYSAGWRTPGPVDKGAVAFCNKVTALTSLPVGLVNGASSGTALRQEAAAGNGYYINTAGATADRFITNFTNVIDKVGNDFAGLIIANGERDARSTLVTQQEFTDSFATLISEFRNALVNANTPICINYLGKGTNVADVDSDFQGIRNAQKTLIRRSSSNYSVNTIDFAQRDDIHDSNHTVRAERSAQTMLKAMGLVTYSDSPTIRNIEKISSTVFDVHLNHVGGTDFTPTTAITGFEAFDDGVTKAITSVVRQSASVIRITMTSAIVGVFTLRYLYGKSPVITGDVLDNSTMSLPLEWADTFAINNNSGVTLEVAPGINISL